MNKKAKETPLAIWLLSISGVILVFALVAWMFNIGGIQQTQVTDEKTQDTVVETAQKAKTVAASRDVYVYDLETNNPYTASVVTSVYRSKNGEGYTDIGDSSASAALKLSQINTNDKIKLWAFNLTQTSGGTAFAAYEPTEIDIGSIESDIVKLTTHSIADGTEVSVELFDENDQPRGTPAEINTSNVGASGSYTYSKIQFKVNESDKSYNLGGFYTDLVQNTNISNVELGGSVSFSGKTSSEQSGKPSVTTSLAPPTSSANFNPSALSTPQRLKGSSQGEYVFWLSRPVLVHETDKVDVDSLKLTADGDGCNTEEFDIYAFDVAPFLSSKNSNVYLGAENDQASPADVGAADSARRRQYCT